MMYKYDAYDMPGVYLLHPDIFSDQRGRITKIFYKESFEEMGMECNWGESLITENNERGIIRGFHFQAPPYAQAKTICCVTGKIRNWVLDIRKQSPTYGKMLEFELEKEKRDILYVPRGVANCYYIEEQNTVISYNLTSKYAPAYAEGISWRSFSNMQIKENVICSEKDDQFPLFQEFDSPFVYGQNC